MSLEPIDEKDLDLGSKFGTSEAEKTMRTESPVETVPKIIEESVEIEKPKEIISAEKDSMYSKILSKVKTSPTKDAGEEEIRGDAKEVSEKQDAESQIQHLVDVAQTKGVVHAVRVAQHLEDNYVLDMFHDKLLSEELHDALLSKGLIEEM